ncbi:MAG: DNA polymerase III subunit delta [Alphaproteobacteria bacterium]|nr:DNA polymerase III subunit delta [Alphaproteobacteria bacterium]
MKVQPGKVDSFLAKPDANVRAVLLYGPDAGLVRERADKLARLVVPDDGDPFRISELAAGDLADDPPRLNDEAAALCFGGGRRVVRVRDAGDRLVDVFESFLADPPGEALVVVEAGDGVKKLRAAFEGAKAGAAIACYAEEGAALAGAVRQAFQARGLKASDAAVMTLVALLGPDRMLLHAEVEKLALYVGEGKAGEGSAVEEEDVLALAADAAETSLDDAIDAALSGNRALTDQALRRLAAEGEAPVRAMRGLARHFLRVAGVQARIEAGEPMDSALRSLRPPLFFKRERAFRAQLQLWRGRRLADALDRVTQAELRCKETGQPDRLLSERVFLELAAAARGAG